MYIEKKVAEEIIRKRDKQKINEKFVCIMPIDWIFTMS